MSFFEVQPETLVRQGHVISGESNTLSAVALRLRMIGGSAPATGFPDAAAALDHFCGLAAARTELMRDAVDGIGEATGKSGWTYTIVDRNIAEDLSDVGERLADVND